MDWGYSLIADVSKRPWLRDFARHTPIFANLNGPGLGPNEELSRKPTRVERQLLSAFGAHVIGLSEAEIDEWPSRGLRAYRMSPSSM